MKKYLLIFCLLHLFSCTAKDERNDPQQTPEALQDHKETKLVSFSKRGPDDLVDALYKEAIKNSPGLATLEKDISKLNEKKNDSLGVFEEYKFKNQDYYSSATRRLNSIQDSLLKKAISAVYEKSNLDFRNSISQLNNLEDELSKQSIYSNDHQIALKLLVTLGMMNKYTKNNFPSFKSLESVLKEYNTLNHKLDSAIMKNK